MKILITSHSSEDGVASIEFALCFILILALILGMGALSMYVWAQQKLSYAAGEGSRTISAWQHSTTSNNQPCDLILSQAQPSVCASAESSLDFLQVDTTCSLHYSQCTQVEHVLLEEWQVCSFDLTLRYNTQNQGLLHLLTQTYHTLSKSSLAAPQLQASSSVNIMCLKENSL